MREPETPEETAIQCLKDEWTRKAGKVFRSSESFFVHIPVEDHFFVPIEQLVPTIESLDYLSVLETYRLSKGDLKRLRSSKWLREEPKTYIQFGEVRVEGFPHWQPVVTSFDLVPVLVQEAKNEWDRCQFIKKEILNNPAGSVAKRNVERIEALEKETSRATANLEKANDIPGFLRFRESGLFLSKLPMLERFL
ncbi:hypothetical protein [Marinobacter shengliensis]|uniref:hypothetical protein n=1 Tax=Marinobacter shengliensis TaxID=1389223 RepID=UPI000D0E60AF|nr:hypothetical protein [Marinobacter shengliensis]PSF14827.1 hypothetical protein C7H10_03490 [Marinobacter shengliensis]